MLPVALVRPMWPMAWRSVRFVTALVLMALLLGAGGARLGPAAGPGADGFRPSAAVARSSAVQTAPAADPVANVGQPPAADERPDVTDDDAPTTAHRLADLVGLPDGTAVGPGAGPRVRIAVDGYVGTIGSRAPPLG